MRAKKSVVLREIAGEHILVPSGSDAGEVMGIMTLNDSGVLLWKLLCERECTTETLIESLLGEYEVEPGKAAADVESFINSLNTVKLLE